MIIKLSLINYFHMTIDAEPLLNITISNVTCCIFCIICSLVDDQNYEQDSGKFGRDKMMSNNRPYCAHAKECMPN